MTKIVVVIREIGGRKPDYSLEFDVPEVPRAGDYISIQRPDKRPPWGEDAVVRKVWWRLNHPELGAYTDERKEKTGALTEVMVECDPALSPYSSEQWRKMLEGAKARGVDIPEFEVVRLAIRLGDEE